MKKTLSLAMIAIFGVTVLASCNKNKSDLDRPDETLGEELKAMGDTTDAMFIDVKSDTVIQGADSVNQIITQVVATPE